MSHTGRRQRLGIVRLTPEQMHSHRIEVSRGRALSGEDISGLTISGRCLVVLVNGERFTAYDFGQTCGAQRIVRESDGMVFMFGPGWIRSLRYFFERREPFRGGVLRRESRLYRGEE